MFTVFEVTETEKCSGCEIQITPAMSPYLVGSGLFPSRIMQGKHGRWAKSQEYTVRKQTLVGAGMWLATVCDTDMTQLETVCATNVCFLASIYERHYWGYYKTVAVQVIPQSRRKDQKKAEFTDGK